MGTWVVFQGKVDICRRKAFGSVPPELGFPTPTKSMPTKSTQNGRRASRGFSASSTHRDHRYWLNRFLSVDELRLSGMYLQSSFFTTSQNFIGHRADDVIV
jgi:hypothetical protein